MIRTRRSARQTIDIWPGFVDALSTLLLAVIFMLVVFVMGQFFVSQLLHQRDTAVLERATNIRMLPIDYLWSDVGSWAALTETREPDAGGNFSSLSGGGALVAEDAQGCIVYAEEDELVALLGVRDLVVVRAGDATLVCPRDRVQDVRRIVDRLSRERPRFL